MFVSSTKRLHVIAITESWLGSVVEDSIVAIDGYSLIRNDRNTRGGGVALYVHESLSVSCLCVSDVQWTARPGVPEYILAEVGLKGGPPVFVAVVYRPPHALFIEGSSFVIDLSDNMYSYSTKVILGDFNADLLSDSPDAGFVRRLIAENSLFAIPYGPTHHTATSDTLLDLCLVDSNDTVASHWQSDTPFIAGHDVILAEIDIQLPEVQHRDFTYRDFKSIDRTLLNRYLANGEWFSVEEDGGVSLESALKQLYSNLQAARDEFAPLRCCRNRKLWHPWFTPYHRSLIRERDRLYRRFKRSRLPCELQEYRRAGDYAHEQIEIARLDYYWRRLRGLSDPQSIWKELRHLGLAPCTTGREPVFTAEELNAHFANISYDAVAPSLSSVVDAMGEASARVDGLHFEFREITLSDINCAVKRSSSQAVGVDGIPQCFVSAALPAIGPFLRHIFNKSLSLGTFPDMWKQSLVVVLGKVRSPVALSDYRPISLLCFLSKVLERLVHDQMSSYLQANNLVDDLQTAYRTGHSTQTALIKLTDDIRQGIDRRRLTALLQFDFSKAFDRVCHATLLAKLRGLGFSVSTLRWLASYLTGRSQAVRSGSASLSSFRQLNRGVPQGSVLGPLLFTVFVGDIAADLDAGVRHVIYADDLQIYVQGTFEDIDHTLRSLCSNAERVSSWAEVNKLDLNLEKTSAIVFGSANYVNRLAQLSVTSVRVNDMDIPIVATVKSLGVTLDAKLDWRAHVLTICKRANSLLYRLNFFRRSTNFELRKHLVTSLLFPIVDYCCVVQSDITSELNLVIQRVVNSGVRYIFGVRKSSRISPFRRQLGWLTVAGRRDYFAACLVYKLINTETPSYLSNMLLIRAQSRPRRGDNMASLVVPQHRTVTLARSFHVHYSAFWNSLPSTIKSASSLTIFKHRLFTHIFTTEGES